MLDNSLGTISKDPVWRKFSKNTTKMSADHMFLDKVEFEKQEIYAYICI